MIKNVIQIIFGLFLDVLKKCQDSCPGLNLTIFLAWLHIENIFMISCRISVDLDCLSTFLLYNDYDIFLLFLVFEVGDAPGSSQGSLFEASGFHFKNKMSANATRM